MTGTANASAKAPDPLIGKTLAGRFRVLSRIATGGMGVVYKAEQLPLGRVVALKVLEAKHTPEMDDKFRQRFFLEAAAAAKLSHPNTIVVYDYGQAEDGVFYIAMEHVGGGTVERHLKDNGPFTPAQAIHMGLQVCSSLRDAHEQGLVHRDLKPGNVMFAPRAGDPFFVKVLDFGLVKVLASAERDDGALTQNGVVMGSPRYMAPEQVRSLAVDHRADIYSFGATLYHMLTGAPPFAEGKAFDAMAAHVNMQPPSLHETWSGCMAGDALEDIVMACLEKSPDDRFQSMEEVMVALHGCAQAAGSLTSGTNYLSHVSLPPHQASELSDSNPSHPRATDPASPTQSNPALRASSSGSHSSPRISGPRRRQDAVEGVEVDVVVDERPPPKRRLSKVYLVAAGGVAVVAAIAGLAAAMSGESPPPPSSAPSVATVPVPSEPGVGAVPAPVRLSTTPPGARARHDGSDLGDTPLDVPIPAGERWQIELSLPGYHPRVVTVLSGQARLGVTLQAVPAPSAPQAEPVQATTGPARRWPIRRPPRAGGQASDDSEANADIHDPWNEEE